MIPNSSMLLMMGITVPTKCNKSIRSSPLRYNCAHCSSNRTRQCPDGRHDRQEAFYTHAVAAIADDLPVRFELGFIGQHSGHQSITVPAVQHPFVSLDSVLAGSAPRLDCCYGLLDFAENGHLLVKSLVESVKRFYWRMFHDCSLRL
jgi:hypothetical protein